MDRGFRLLPLLALFISSVSVAYTPTNTPEGKPVRWKGAPMLWVAGNPTNQSGLGEAEFYDAAVRSLQRWKSASGGVAGFEYWQGTQPDVYVPASSYDGLSALYFASNSKSDRTLSQNVLGLTQVWYDTKTGEILETDIVLNDRAFRFTTSERDTSGYGSGATSFVSGRSNVFVENVLTHELGHAMGLSHSGGMQSTMLYMESPEQAHLGCDDLTAVHALYPGRDAAERGGIGGRVVTGSGAPVFGAHVLAVSRRRGTVLASGLTDKSGAFRIGALEAGEYFLVVEPFYAGGQTLPPYYSSMALDQCSGKPFARTVLTEADGFTLLAVAVKAGETAAAPLLSARCNSGGGAAVLGDRGSALLTTAPLLLNGLSGQGGSGITDRFNFSGTNYYRLQGISGRLELHVLSYSLYSPVRPVVSLVSADGLPVEAPVQHAVYEGASGFVNMDAAIRAENLPPGDYILEVSAERVDATYYPGGPVSLDSVPFLLITASLNEKPPALAGSLPVNARCRLDEAFGSYSSPSGGPYRRATDNEDEVGFCGTLQRPSSGGGPGTAAIVGWFLPFAAMMLLARASRGWGRRPREAS
ncbi:MAG: carboxypeptidase regulatory-like domain-containing protein [Oligoflexia bacterium]|nr:carboxypeptidase regulatory-like domain-containing protein [Oligoflexia bacterium]